ncbi:MAG TPA: hypothetical protein VMN57_07845 [Anaerolineales bacterium]|nr:hypothetical protein [Anaerolineales bacterium]
MRPIEIILVLSFLAFLWFGNNYRTKLGFLPILVTAAQFLFEGYRWQMIPLYVLAAALGVVPAVATLRRQAPPAGRRRLAPAIGGTLLVLLAAAVPYLLPIPRPFPPTGPYPIGTRTLHLVDDARTDPYAPEPNGSREILVQLWYPAVPVGRTQRAPWMPGADVIAPAVSEWLRLPGFFLDHLIYARTDSYLDMPVEQNDAGWPVILFSHGYGGFRAQNTFQVQELASRGYVVAAIEHTYASVMTVFPDGRVAAHNPDTLPDDVSDAEYVTAAGRLLVQWSSDLHFTLATFDSMNADPDSWLSGSLDLSKLGVMGHSTGGGAAIQFCSEEVRCMAGLAMDPWLLPVRDEVLETGLDRPLLVMFSETWSSDLNTARFRTLADGFPGKLSVFTITGSAHYDFSDLPQISPLSPYLGVKGPIDGDTLFAIVNAYSVDFFEMVLRGRAPELAYSGSSQYPEISFRMPGR